MTNIGYAHIIEAIEQEPVTIPEMPSIELRGWINGYFTAEQRIIKKLKDMMNEEG